MFRLLRVLIGFFAFVLFLPLAFADQMPITVVATVRFTMDASTGGGWYNPTFTNQDFGSAQNLYDTWVTVSAALHVVEQNCPASPDENFGLTAGPLVADSANHKINGILSNYTFSVFCQKDGSRRILNGVPAYNTVYAYAACPNNFTVNKVSDPVTGDQTVTCSGVQPRLDPAPNTCPASPYPVFAETGLKWQKETDISSPGMLQYERIYRSDIRRWVLPGDASLADSTQPTTFDRCYFGYFGVESACFSYVSGAPQAAMSAANGNLNIYNVATGSGVTTYTPVYPNNNTRLVSATYQGAKGLLQYNDDASLDFIDSTGRMMMHQLSNGQSLAYAYSIASTATSIAPHPGLLIAMTDSFGRSLAVTYDSGGNAASVSDPNGGNVSYSYNGSTANCSGASYFNCSRLSSVKYQDLNTKSYYFNELDHLLGGLGDTNMDSVTFPYLTGIMDEGGGRLSDYFYDANSLIYKSGWGGLFYQFSNGGTTTTVTDPNQVVRTYTHASILGSQYPTAQSQPSGSGCNAASSAKRYDANANVVQEDDFNGNRRCFAYDLTRNLQTTTLEGLPSTKACPASLQSYSPSPADANHPERLTTTIWHPIWRLKTREAAPKRISTIVYNGQVDPIIGDGLTVNCAPATATLLDGSPLAVVCRRYEQATSDNTGVQGFSAKPSGNARLWTYTYNQYGQILSETMPKQSARSSLKCDTAHPVWCRQNGNSLLAPERNRSRRDPASAPG